MGCCHLKHWPSLAYRISNPPRNALFSNSLWCTQVIPSNEPLAVWSMRYRGHFRASHHNLSGWERCFHCSSTRARIPNRQVWKCWLSCSKVKSPAGKSIEWARRLYPVQSIARFTQPSAKTLYPLEYRFHRNRAKSSGPYRTFQADCLESISSDDGRPSDLWSGGPMPSL